MSSIPDRCFWCSCCGRRIEDEFATHQYREANRTEGTVCMDCAEFSLINRYNGAFSEIREALNEEQTEKWDELEEWRKARFAEKLFQDGTLQIQGFTSK